MKLVFRKITAVLALVAMFGLTAFGQALSTGAIAGSVTDPAGAVMTGATIVVKNDANGVENTVQTADNGTFNVPGLQTGSYTVTVTAPNFKQTVVKDVKVNIGTPSSINVALEVGAVSETVTITGGGGELLQTQSATVGQTITGRQITDLPQASRDALDLVLLLPGTNTPGTPRTSTVNGLPKGSLNITLDGVNVQDNTSKSAFGGGFFTYVRPRIDAIDEVTISTATPGAESSGEGAVQIKFETRSGSNELHGSLYEYHRESSFNANYWFNNRAGLARDPIHLNQYGGRAGGPVIIPHVYTKKNKLFFFTNLEEYRLPEAISRQRTILNTAAQTGIFTTSTGAQVNLLTLAAGTNCGTVAVPVACTSTVDPTIGSLLGRIRSSTSQGTITPLDNNRQQFNFTNLGGQLRRFAAVRFDYNISDKHRFANTWNYQRFGGAAVDFLNSVDPPFPGFLAGVGGQHSLRWSDSASLTSNLTSRLVNVARAGFEGGNSFFRDTVSPASFSDLGGFSLALGSGLTNPQASRSNSRRNAPVKTFADTATWSRGAHSVNFGGTFSRYSTWSNAINNLVPSVTFALDATDPASAIFVASKFPTGTSAADLTLAGSIYALLTGRVTSVAANAYLDENTGKLAYLGTQVNRFREDEYGFFAQDAWRFRPNLTINYGLRYEVQAPIVTQNNAVTFTPFEQIFGVSGEGNLFAPGKLTGKPTEFNILPAGQSGYKADHNNFLPSVGIAYSPDWKSGLLHRAFGNGGQTVLRAGYSIATVREGLSIASSILASNPGGITDASRSVALGNLTAGSLFRNAGTTTPPTINPTIAFPVRGAVTGSANAFERDLRIGYVQSWSAGIQRELTKDMVMEVRYVGNRGVKLWRQVNLNEINLIENNYANEFKLAQANLQANIAAGRGNTYRYAGPGTGTNPLPITLAYFSAIAPANAGNCTATGTGAGSCAALYNSSLFTNTTLLGQLALTNPQPNAFANNVFNNTTRSNNAATAGLPANEFIVNPDYRGGAFLVTNTGRSYYDALTVELRRRFAQGLLVQSSYTWSKSLTNIFASNNDLFVNPPSFRNDRLGRVDSPFDLRHGFKADWIYELPFGRGKQFAGDVGKLTNWAVGGWEWQGTARLQSGSAFNFGNVQLVGLTRNDLQHAIEVRKGTSAVFFLPQDVIDNTIKAFNTSGTTANGYSSAGAPTGRFIAPAGFGNCVQASGGQCGFAQLIIHGPRFFRFDTSVIKRFHFTEKTNIELRAEFLNAINNQNFRVGSAGSEVVAVTNFSSSAFGQTAEAYRDISTTNDPGGRIIQFVFRFNF